MNNIISSSNKLRTDAKNLLFSNMAREFTPYHIQTLFFLNQNHPIRVNRQMNAMQPKSQYDIIVELEPSLKDLGEDFLNAILGDLKSKSLINTSRLEDILVNSCIKKQTTSLGEEFLIAGHKVNYN